MRKDLFQDYDVVYIVTETKSFREDREWINRFGKRLYMQYPEENIYYPSDVENCYGWLDGNRLDLHVCTLKNAPNGLEPYINLVDKDNLMPEKQMISDKKYWVTKPTQEQFHCTCNEFWRCLNNVAKGLWREEIPYVMDMINFQVRPMFRRLLEWKIGMENNFSVSVGKSAKYMDKYISKEIYQKYLQTYSLPQVDTIWDAVLNMCDLFGEIASEVNGKLNFSYDLAEADSSKGYLHHIRNLPPDAEKVF